MLLFKRITLVMLAASASMAASANSASSQLTPTPTKNAWHAGVTALYLQPNLGGNSLGYASFSNYGTDFANNQVEVNGAPNHLSSIDPNRTWSFKLDGGYDFNAVNDVDLNWYHLDERTNSQLPNGTLFAGSASSLYAGQIHLQTQWDAVNLVVGQRFDLSKMNIFHLYAGLDVSRIQNKFTNYPQLTVNGTPIFVTNDTLTYIGVGPRIGGDYIYNSGFGFGIYAKAAGSLLVGTAKQSVSGYHDLGGFNLYSTGNYNQSNDNVVVPELEANLGLKYDVKLQQGTLGFDLGYMFATYLGAIVSQVGAGVVSSSISTSSSTNFNLNGPYFGVTWTG